MAVDLDIIETVTSPPLQGLGLELVALEHVTVRGRQTLRVYIDQPGGVTLDDCVRATHALNELPELEALLPGSFDLEVSSPGIERPLRKASDFLRFVGERAQIRMRTGLEGRRNLIGRIVAVEGEAVRMEVEGDLLSVPLSDIFKANLKPDMAELLARGRQ